MGFRSTTQFVIKSPFLAWEVNFLYLNTYYMTCIYIYTYSSLQKANICTYHRCGMYARWNLYEMSLLLQFCLLDMYIQIQHHGQWNTMKFTPRFWLLLQCLVKCDRFPCLETPFGRPVLEKNYCATQSATMLPGAYKPLPPLGGVVLNICRWSSLLTKWVLLPVTL